MKFKKTTVLGVILSLALVAGVTVAFASGPKAPAVPDEDSTTSTAPSTSVWSMTTDGNHGLRYFSLNLDYLEQALNKQVADGSMTREEADRIVEQARTLSGNGEELEWVFPEDSGLVQDSFDENGNYRPGFNVFYKDADGKLTPVDLATVVSEFIFPVEQDGVRVSVDVDASRNPVIALPDTVIYRGRAYNRADLSAETLEWLDWYLALPEEERLAVSYEPWELRDITSGQSEWPVNSKGKTYGEVQLSYLSTLEYPDLIFVSAREETDWIDGYIPFTPLAHPSYPGTVEGPGEEFDKYLEWLETQPEVLTQPLYDCEENVIGQFRSANPAKLTSGAEQTVPEVVPDYDPEVEDPAGEMGSSFYDYSVADASGVAAGKVVCPVEGCTVRGTHTHDGVTYLCNGAHCGGVCDGSCAAAWNEADTASTAAPVSSGHHSDSHHGNGYQGGHH